MLRILQIVPARVFKLIRGLSPTLDLVLRAVTGTTPGARVHLIGFRPLISGWKQQPKTYAGRRG